MNPQTPPHGTPARLSPSTRRWLMVLLAGLMCTTNVGCLQPLMALGLIFGGPPSVEPDFDKKTNISLDEKDRKVVVLCYAPKEVKFDFDNVDRELTTYVSHRLKENKIKVIDPDAVAAWLDEHADDWDKPEELGRDLEADFVIFLEVSEFSLYEEHSNTLSRGRSQILISTYQMENGEGNEIYSKELMSKFPTLQAESTSDRSYYDFKRMYLSRLSDEIGRHFYSYYTGDDIPYSALND